VIVYSFGVDAFVFSALPPETSSSTIRRAFLHFYLFVMATAAAAAALLWPRDQLSAGLMIFVALTTLPSRQLLVPAINRATDAGAKSQFEMLHGLSMVTALAHIGIVGLVLSRFLLGERSWLEFDRGIC
jgi:hypothetical protein